MRSALEREQTGSHPISAQRCRHAHVQRRLQAANPCSTAPPAPSSIRSIAETRCAVKKEKRRRRPRNMRGGKKNDNLRNDDGLERLREDAVPSLQHDHLQRSGDFTPFSFLSLHLPICGLWRPMHSRCHIAAAVTSRSYASCACCCPWSASRSVWHRSLPTAVAVAVTVAEIGGFACVVAASACGSL
jgi:hypothetical protein